MSIILYILIFAIGFIGFFIGIITTCLIHIFKKPQPIECLKNALLSYVFMKYGKIDDSPINNYKNFDGSVLPAFSGFDTVNACFSYIQSQHELIFGKFQTQIMQDKNDAILKYIEKNLNTYEKVVELFDKLSGPEAPLTTLADCA